MPSRRHCRQSGPIYLAKLLSLPFLLHVRFTAMASAFVPLNKSVGQEAYTTNQTLRFFGGRHPLCGIGVTSRITRTSMPAVDSARTALSRPDPGPDTRTSTDRSPLSDALLAAVIAACCAANGVPLRDPRKPSEPALDQEMVLPSWSEMVTIVLLNVACTCTTPVWTTRFSFFLKLFFLPALTGAFAIRYVLPVAFFLFATVPRRGPFRVRALVWVRCPRTGRLRRWRSPRYEPISM